MIPFLSPVSGKEGSLLKKSRLFPAKSQSLLGVLLLAALLLTACSSTTDSWAGVSKNSETGTVYVSYERHVVAINPTSGAIQWNYGDKSTKFFATPVVSDGVLYIGDYKGRLHAINAETGEKEWVYTPKKETLVGPLSLTADDRVIGGVVVDSSLIYFGLGSRNVVAVSRETGEKVWSFDTDHGVWATPIYVPAKESDSASVPTLYVVSLDHYLYAINAETGKELWRKNMGGAMPGTPAYDPERNRLYVGTFLSEVVAVDLTSREIVTRFKTDNWVWSGPALDGDMLYFGDLKGNLYAVQIIGDELKQVWKKDVAKKAIRSTPLIAGDVVVVSSKDEHVYALNKADGLSLWSKKTKGPALTELVLVPASTEGEGTPEMVVAGTDDKDRLLVAYTLDSGEEKWHYSYKN
jgi:outer membrane protein assembly factor BamB